MNRRIANILLILLLLGTTQPAQLSAQTIDRVVAVVNDQVITMSELNQEGATVFKRIKAEAPLWQAEELLQKARSELLGSMVDRLLLQQRAKSYNITVSDAELDAAINNIMASNQRTEAQFRSELAMAGHDFDQYREVIRNQILQHRLFGYEVGSKIVISDEKISDYYHQHYLKKDGADGYHILQLGVALPAESDDESLETARRKAEQLRQRILSGEKFEEVARAESDLPSAEDGGDIGTFAKEELAGFMRESIIKLKPGELSRVIETPTSLQLFKLLAIREGDTVVQASLDSVKEEIRESLYRQEVASQFDKWVAGLRDTAYIKLSL